MRALWTALYAGRATHEGASLEHTLTYVTMSMVIYNLFPNSLIMAVNERIRSGSILFDIARPLYYGRLLLFQELGKTISALFTSTLPLLFLAVFLLDLDLPRQPALWLAFVVSLCLAIAIAFYIDYLCSLAGFWITEMGGMRFMKWSVSDILSGAYIPLWVFPDPWRDLVMWLPFRGMHYAPLSILSGRTDLDAVPAQLVFQAAWIAALYLGTRAVYAVIVRKLAVQGG